MTKPDYKFMHVILNQSIRLNARKAMFAVFLYFVLQFFMMGIAMAPITVNSLFTVFLTLGLLIGMNLCSEILLFGLYVIMARFIEKKYVTIGFLFIGFRKNQKRIFKSALFFTLIYVGVIILLSIVYFFCADYFSKILENINSHTLLSIAALIVLFLTMIISIPFSFVRLILYRDDKIKVLQAFKDSFLLMKGRFFHFIGFILYACKKPLIQVILIQVFLFIFSAGANSSGSLQLLITFLGIVGIMAQYRALTILFMAITIYYYTLIGVLYPHKTEAADPPISIENME
ncbi:MAG: hypothetical protein K6G00_09705 [Treponema sp.]|nr:hypothetical protein [Treponema sp.]